MEQCNSIPLRCKRIFLILLCTNRPCATAWRSMSDGQCGSANDLCVWVIEVLRSAVISLWYHSQLSHVYTTSATKWCSEMLTKRICFVRLLCRIPVHAVLEILKIYTSPLITSAMMLGSSDRMGRICRGGALFRQMYFVSRRTSIKVVFRQSIRLIYGQYSLP